MSGEQRSGDDPSGCLSNNAEPHAIPPRQNAVSNPPHQGSRYPVRFVFAGVEHCLTVEEARANLERLTRAIDAVVHRDLKPGNVTYADR